MKSIQEIKENWEEQKGNLQHKMAILTNNNLLFGDSKNEEILGRLQLKYGKTKEQLLDIIVGH